MGKQFYITGRALLRMALPILVRYIDLSTILMTAVKFKPAVANTDIAVGCCVPEHIVRP